MQATARIFFLKAPAKRTVDNKCPVKICITHKNERKYYSLTDKLSNSDWNFLSDDEIEKVTSKNGIRGKYKDIANEYKKIINIADAIIIDIQLFSFNQFENQFFNRPTDWNNVFSAFWDHIQYLKDEDRFNYASSFESTLRAIKEFHTKKKFTFNPRTDKIETREKIYLTGNQLNFVDITPKWLNSFEKWLRIENNSSTSTIGIYMRNIRVLFNIAISPAHKVKAEYPFGNGNGKYKPKNADGRKVAITVHEISLIANYKTDHQVKQFYKDIFIFSFFANGINLSDIARLKYSNISKNEISFIRKKTKAENTKEIKIEIPITETLKEIIDKHGTRAIGFDAYIFQILKPGMNERQIITEIKNLTKQVNKYVREIATELKIDDKISSYSARHSFATILKNSGTSIEFIKEALGHSSTSVTENYLKSFEDSERLNQSQKLEDLVRNQKAV